MKSPVWLTNKLPPGRIDSAACKTRFSSSIKDRQRCDGSTRLYCGAAATLSCSCVLMARAAEPLPVVTDVELQPLAAGVKRVAQALELAGSPLSKERQAALDAALATNDPAAAAKQIQAVLDPLCLVGREHQSRKPSQGGRRPGAAGARATRAPPVPCQGAQRRGRHRAVARVEPQRRADGQALHQQPRTQAVDQAGRGD